MFILCVYCEPWSWYWSAYWSNQDFVSNANITGNILVCNDVKRNPTSNNTFCFLSWRELSISDWLHDFNSYQINITLRNSWYCYLYFRSHFRQPVLISSLHFEAVNILWKQNLWSIWGILYCEWLSLIQILKKHSVVNHRCSTIW